MLFVVLRFGLRLLFWRLLCFVCFVSECLYVVGECGFVYIIRLGLSLCELLCVVF